MVGSFTGQVYTLDKTAPVATSILRQSPSNSLTNENTLVFQATFNEAMLNVDAADFAARRLPRHLGGLLGVMPHPLAIDPVVRTIDRVIDHLASLATVGGDGAFHVVHDAAIAIRDGGQQAEHVIMACGGGKEQMEDDG